MLMAAALNFVVDPLQLFRPARLFPAMYSTDSRMQDAGLIRSQDFDTVFMGTSLAIHFRQSDIDRMLGVRSLKLSMTGSNSHEQSFVLAAALERHPKRVIWQIDDWIFRDAPEIDSDVYLPADLYRRNAKGIAGYLFSGAMARESLWMLARSLPPLRAGRRAADHRRDVQISDRRCRRHQCAARRISTSPAAYNAKKAMAAFRHITDPVRSRYLAEGYDYDAMVRNFERDAIGLIAKHPDVTFDIYFPPYSILQFVAMRDASPATLKIVYDFTAYAQPAAGAVSECPACMIFARSKDITHDLGNYGDVIHHSPAIDLKVLSMAGGAEIRVDRVSAAGVAGAAEGAGRGVSGWSGSRPSSWASGA